MNRIITSIALVIAASFTISCNWISTKDITELQPELNNKFCGQTTEQILNVLGQPTSSKTDTLDNISIVMLRFEDSLILKKCDYSKEFQTEDPFIEIYIKNGKVFSVKSNMVRTIISRNEKNISIIKLATYAGVLLLALIITFISVLLVRQSFLKKTANQIQNIEANLEKYNEKVVQITKRINTIENKFVKIDKKILETELFIKQTEQASELPSLYDNLSFEEQEKFKHLLSSPVEYLLNSTRIKTALANINIKTLGQLCSYSKKDLKDQDGFSNNSIIKIEHTLKQMNLNLGMNLHEFGYDKYNSPIIEDAPSENHENTSGS